MKLKTWQSMHKPENQMIVQASSMNGHDDWQPFPIGMQYNYIYNTEHMSGDQSNLVLCAIVSNTDKKRRPSGVNREKIIHNLHKNNIQNTLLTPDIYFKTLSSYKFVISPEGNGIDCHRHYEALIAGCIPIIERNHLIETKYKGCPILYTTDYSEITEEYLNKKWDEMIECEYDFSRLFLQYYSIPQQRDIKTCGNFWIQRMCKRKWYYSA
jgi:hypothetical protein